METRPTFGEVLKNSGFRYLWINQILVQLAYNILNFALLIWVFKLTNSNLAVASLMLAVYLPSLFFGMIAGIYVDIANRRRIILIIDILLALSFLMFVWVKDSYPLILVTAFFVNTLGQFFVPTESSSIPMLVSRRHLLLANSLFSLTLYGSFMVGFSAAGPIISLRGIEAVFYLGFVATALAWLLSLNLPPIGTPSGNKFTSIPSTSQLNEMIKLVFQEAKEAARFIKGKLNILVSILLMAGMQGVIGILAVIISSYMETVLHINATDASYVLMIPLGLGMIVGAFLIGRFAHHIPKRLLVIPALITVGILFILAGITPYVAHLIQAADLPDHIRHPRIFSKAPSLSTIFAFGSFLLGLCAVSIIVPAQTVLQENTTEENRGKIFAVLLVVMNMFAAVVSVFAGLLADILGAALIFIIMGSCVLPLGIIVRSPAKFLQEHHLSYKVREFLGLGHWER